MRVTRSAVLYILQDGSPEATTPAEITDYPVTPTFRFGAQAQASRQAGAAAELRGTDAAKLSWFRELPVSMGAAVLPKDPGGGTGSMICSRHRGAEGSMWVKGAVRQGQKAWPSVGADGRAHRGPGPRSRGRAGGSTSRCLLLSPSHRLYLGPTSPVWHFLPRSLHFLGTDDSVGTGWGQPVVLIPSGEACVGQRELPQTLEGQGPLTSIHPGLH